MKKAVEFVKNDKRILITGVIIILLVIIGTVLALTLGNTTAFNLESDLKDMGKDFYENYYYDQLGKTVEEKEKFLERYQTQGIKINLSNLGRYNKNVNEEIIKNFVNPKTKEACDEENTKVIIYPKSPYGKMDYTMEVELVCGLEEK